ncbi:hypothetical protein AND_008785 [Anopheles darlingi]|uniref:Uncharacterized protein n=1 Tax=Anopheles darlingi TaxID=43151 RepID=W5J582_ANODA|nr:hypothetical protein AND_008785 [Anopheles darlingi]
MTLGGGVCQFRSSHAAARESPHLIATLRCGACGQTPLAKVSSLARGEGGGLFGLFGLDYTKQSPRLAARSLFDRCLGVDVSAAHKECLLRHAVDSTIPTNTTSGEKKKNRKQQQPL